MAKLTLGACRPTIARVLGKCDDSAEVITYLNEAQARLVPRGRWVGTYQRYRICTDSACLTWPRQIETIEAFAVCERPGTLRDFWYETVLVEGNGLLDEDTSNAELTLIDKGEGYVLFRDIAHVATQPKKVKATADVAEASTAYVIIQGYDENNTWIRTLDAGVWIDGEKLSLATGAATSTKYFSSVTGAIKTTTNGLVRLYEYNPTTGVLVAIAQYENDETLPSYRRSLIPDLSNMSSCCDESATCDNKAVNVLAKLHHMPLTRDNDFLILRNLAALKLMVMAIVKEEKNLVDEAMAYEAKAVAELEHELQSHIGAGVVPVPRMMHSSLWGGGGVMNYV